MDIRPYDLVIFQGVNPKGEHFRVIGFTKSLKENQNFIDDCIAQGTPIVDLDPTDSQ